MPHLRRISFILFLAAWFSAARAAPPLLREATGLAGAGGKDYPRCCATG